MNFAFLLGCSLRKVCQLCLSITWVIQWWITVNYSLFFLAVLIIFRTWLTTLYTETVFWRAVTLVNLFIWLYCRCFERVIYFSISSDLIIWQWTVEFGLAVAFLSDTSPVLFLVIFSTLWSLSFLSEHRIFAFVATSAPSWVLRNEYWQHWAHSSMPVIFHWCSYMNVSSFLRFWLSSASWFIFTCFCHWFTVWVQISSTFEPCSASIFKDRSSS